MHIPVLQKEVLEYLAPKSNENFIDATIGEGGHTLAILEKNEPRGKVLGIEWDPEIIKNCQLSRFGRGLATKSEQIKNFKERVVLICDNFANLKEIVKREKFKSVQGILFDLGISSWHLEKSGRGFSFLKDEPLDMRYNPQIPLTAEKILNYWSALEIEKFLREYGEEKFSKEITKKIIDFRKIKPIKKTSQLVEIIKSATPGWYHRKRINPATKTFQALRIAVNNELNNLEKVLPKTLEVLGPGGRLVVISFHSLEDRIVKNFLRENLKKNLLKISTKKTIKPSFEEIKVNPRSRSARMRAAIKI